MNKRILTEDERAERATALAAKMDELKAYTLELVLNGHSDHISNTDALIVLAARAFTELNYLNKNSKKD